MSYRIFKKCFVVVLLSLFSSLLFVSCGEEKKSTSDQESAKNTKKEKILVDYKIVEPELGLTEDKKPYPLYVKFDGSVAKIEDLYREHSSQITISPAINGKWKWEGDSALSFTPSENWSLGTKYKVNMPNSIFSDRVYIKGSFNFSTASFTVNITESEFYINPNNPDEKKVICTIAASHPVNSEKIDDNMISLEMSFMDSKGKASRTEKIKYSYSFNKDFTEIYVVSDNIPIPPYTANLKIIVKKGLEAQIGGKTQEDIRTELEIPGMSDYVRINNVSTTLVKNNRQSYDQMIIVETKGAISVDELSKHLKVYELPVDRPKMQGWEERKNFSWSTEYVTDEILKLSKEVEVIPIPTIEPAASTNSFKFSGTPGRYLYFQISGELKFYGGYKLSFEDREFQRILGVPLYQKELGIMSEGSVLTLSGTKKLSLYSRGIDTVYYRLTRIMPKDINHLISMSNGDMKNFQFESYMFNEKNIGESKTSTYNIINPSDTEISYFSYDFTEDLIDNSSKNLSKGLFIFQVSNKPDFNNNYYNSLSEKRLILVTNIGFLVKTNSNNSRDVFVQSISTGRPIPNATVKVIGLNGNPVIATSTDSNGHASIPNHIVDSDREHKPVAYVVESKNDISFMPFSHVGRSLDFSNYDVGGVYVQPDPNRINSFIFNDRGIYRPGEKVHFGIISKAEDWNIDLKDTPMNFEVTDSKGNVVFTQKIQLSSSGFEEIDFSTHDYSPTGFYTAKLYLIEKKSDEELKQLLASNNFQVEEFLPDTLSISTSFSPLVPVAGSGWINPQQLKGVVSLKNMFGTVASGNNVKAQLNLQPGYPVMHRYSDYYFNDPFKKNNSFEEFLGSVLTDENGVANFDIDLSKYEKATYKLSFYAEGFEKGGGRSVSSQSSIYVSPLKYLIGYKADGKLSYINSNSSRKLSFIAIDQNLEKIDLKDVILEINEIKYVSTLVKQSNGLYKYQSVKKSYPVSSQKINISKDGTEFLLPSDTPGEYSITLKNEEDLVFNTINYSIVGDKNISRSLTTTAELELKLENNDLIPGSEAKVFIKAPYAGTGLITVESDSVYNYKWFSTSEPSTVQTIKIPKQMEGNGYITVTFTRDISSDEIFMSPFCYGTVPFSIGKENRINKINLNVPTEIKSGTDLEIEYSTAEPCKIVIFAVDEGILQVASYKTPDPISYFFQKRALQVSTSQILDLLLPEYDILQTLSATGGGAEMEYLQENLNPFKRKINDSVVYWSGIIESDSTKRTVKYNVPDYFNGNIRIMAVAVSKDKMSSAQTQTYAANTFVISPSLPMFATPGDEFDISVTVTNKHKGSGKDSITLQAEPSEHFEIMGEKTKILTIDEGKDETVKFKVKTNNKLGSAEVKFTASDSSEKSILSSTLSVRPLVPYQSWVVSGYSNSGKQQIDVVQKLYDEYAKREVSVSNLPVSFEKGLSVYLEEYPYGCSEQITSKAYPYLYLDFVKNNGKTKDDANKIINDTISILQSRMKYDGNIGYWTTNSNKDSFITFYCAEFLIDARNKGYYVPDEMLQKVKIAIENEIKREKDSSYDIYLRAYGIYILTKSEEVTTHYIEKLENDINKNNYSYSDYEALYLAASYAMLKQDKKANEILKKINRKKQFDSSWICHNDLHYIATYIDVISNYFPKEIDSIKAKEIDTICDYMKDSYFNTYATSAAIRALESLSYVDKSETYKVHSQVNKELKEIELTGERVLQGSFDKNTEKIIFESDKSLPMYYQLSLAGYEENPSIKEVKKGLEITREYKDKGGKTVSQIKVGDTVEVSISFRSLKGSLDNVAIIDLIPAGLEVEIQSVREIKNEYTKNWKPDHIDIREDRIIFYGKIPEKVTTITYSAKAINTGTYNVPPIYAESMYNKETKALSPANPIVIEP